MTTLTRLRARSTRAVINTYCSLQSYEVRTFPITLLLLTLYGVVTRVKGRQEAVAVHLPERRPVLPLRVIKAHQTGSGVVDVPVKLGCKGE